MKNRRLYVWQLLSSSLFCLGTLVPVLTYTICHFNGQNNNNNNNKLAFRIMEGCSWTALAIHILPEMVIDLNTFPKSKRSYPHMRYGTKPFINFLQSILFAAACVFQGFFYCHVWSSSNNNNYNDDNSDEESILVVQSYQIIILIAGHVWLCSGLVTYVSSRWCEGDGERFQYDLSKPIANILDHVANDTYTITTILLCITGYIMILSTAVASVLYALVRAVWAILGTYYFSTDLRKLFLYLSTRLVQADDVDSPLRPSSSTEDDDNNDLDDDDEEKKIQRKQQQRHHKSRRQQEHSQSPIIQESSGNSPRPHPPRRGVSSPTRTRRRSKSPTKEKTRRYSGGSRGTSRGTSRSTSRDKKIRKAAVKEMNTDSSFDDDDDDRLP